jgi:hypothetical protein
MGGCGREADVVEVEVRLWTGEGINADPQCGGSRRLEAKVCEIMIALVGLDPVQCTIALRVAM